jgi:hypothetical protein
MDIYDAPPGLLVAPPQFISDFYFFIAQTQVARLQKKRNNPINFRVSEPGE